MKRNDFIFLLISTTIMVYAWIVFHILHVSKTSTLTDVLNQQIEQIQPNFDINTIVMLKQRQRIDPVYQLQVTETSATSNVASATATIPVSLSPPSPSQGTTIKTGLYQGGVPSL